MNKEKVQAAMDDLKVKQDQFLLSKLEEEYNEFSDKCNKLYTYIYSLDFITKVPDCNERCLMQEQHKRMESYRTNLYQRIDFYRNRVKTACGYDVLVPWSEVLQQTLDEYRSACLHHCGQDADLDDACCQARETCPVGDGSAVVEKPIITGESLKQLIDYQVVGVCEPGFPCEGCVQDHYNTPCCKVELVGGYMLCLAPLHNSIVTE